MASSSVRGFAPPAEQRETAARVVVVGVAHAGADKVAHAGHG